LTPTPSVVYLDIAAADSPQRSPETRMFFLVSCRRETNRKKVVDNRLNCDRIDFLSDETDGRKITL
jgi:hypothetical protein